MQWPSPVSSTWSGYTPIAWLSTEWDTNGYVAAVAAGRLGSLRYKSTQSAFEPITPYLVEGSTYRVRAGIPSKSWVDEDGPTHGEHWETLSGALSHGRSDRVIVTDHIFEPDLTDTRRVHGTRTGQLRHSGWLTEADRRR